MMPNENEGKDGTRPNTIMVFNVLSQKCSYCLENKSTPVSNLHVACFKSMWWLPRQEQRTANVVTNILLQFPKTQETIHVSTSELSQSTEWYEHDDTFIW